MSVTALDRAQPIGPSTPNWETPNSIPQHLVQNWIHQGYVTLRNVFTPEQVSRHNEVVAAVRESIDDGDDEHGFGDRLGMLHVQRPELMDIASNRKIIDFLAWAFGDEPILYGSLEFERGTEQNAHIDAIFFYPTPLYSMAGVWIALEDIKADSGPLFYIPESHRWKFHHSDDLVESRSELRARRDAALAGEIDPASVIGELGGAWNEDLTALHAHMGGEPIKPDIKAGDVVIWHSLLAHGGSARIDPTLSRKSAVFHYVGANTKICGFEKFVMHDQKTLSAMEQDPMEILEYGDLRYRAFPFFAAYPSTGGEAQHVLQEAQPA